MTACGLALLFALVASAPAGAATPYRSITGGGPVESISVGNDLSCQVTYINDIDFEFYPPDTRPGDCGTFLVVNGVLYAPDFESHGRTATWRLDEPIAFTPVSQSSVEGSGSSSSPYRVTTTVDAGGVRVTEKTSYVRGSNSYRIDIALTNRNGGPVDAVLYHAGDCYASGSDIGYGFTRPEVRTAGCSESAQNSPPGRTIQMSPLSAESRYYEASYSEIWEWIATRAPFPNSCRCDEHIDNGVGLSWQLSLGTDPGSGATRALAVSFTESTPPAPGADSDGDGLPDGWEMGTGSSLDFENLAPLGADPNRKDVFVHLDYKQGCAPPAGWERGAIKAFARHGVALHIDSGPKSINADGSRWKGRSRAGPIKFGPDLQVWEGFDALKDRRFVASNRRRAFHYAVIVEKFNGGDGGVSRGLPEADFVLSGCSVPSWLKLGLSRYIAAVFVHELGHNLGLKHGGGDHVNGKPNYYGVMNYLWVAAGGIDRDGDLEGAPLPDYSSETRASIDERVLLSERTPHKLPLAFNCPGTERFDARYEVGTGSRPIDWDCDGVLGEIHVLGRNVNDSWGGWKNVLKGFNDWAPGAMSFGGGGVLGNFSLPERANPPAVPELRPAELRVAQKALARSRREARSRLLVGANRRKLRSGRVAKIRVKVRTAAGKRVRGALIKVRGAKLVSPRGTPRTGRRGTAFLRLRPQRRDVRIFASRRGFERGGLVISVRTPGRARRR